MTDWKGGPESSLARRFRFIQLSKERSVVEEHGHSGDGGATFPIGTFSFRAAEVQGSRNMPCDPVSDGGGGPYGRSEKHRTAKNAEEDSRQAVCM